MVIVSHIRYVPITVELLPLICPALLPSIFCTFLRHFVPFLAVVNLRSRSLYAIARPFVCRLSVTLVHPTQLVAIFGNFFHRTIAQGL